MLRDSGAKGVWTCGEKEVPGRRPSLMLDPPCVLGSASPEKHSEWYIILQKVKSKSWVPLALRMGMASGPSRLVCAAWFVASEKRVRVDYW